MGGSDLGREPGTLKERLEVATSIAVLVAALLVGSYFALHLARDRQADPSSFGPPPGLRITAPSGHDFSRHDRTLLLALSTDCHHCEADVPFYQRLVAHAREADCLNLMAVFPNDPEAVRAFQAAHDLQITSIAEITPKTFGISGTPTLILVDDQGVVEKVWAGELSPERENELLVAVEPSSACIGSPPDSPQTHRR